MVSMLKLRLLGLGFFFFFVVLLQFSGFRSFIGLLGLVTFLGWHLSVELYLGCCSLSYFGRLIVLTCAFACLLIFNLSFLWLKNTDLKGVFFYLHLFCFIFCIKSNNHDICLIIVMIQFQILIWIMCLYVYVSLFRFDLVYVLNICFWVSS